MTLHEPNISYCPLCDQEFENLTLIDNGNTLRVARPGRRMCSKQADVLKGNLKKDSTILAPKLATQLGDGAISLVNSTLKTYSLTGEYERTSIGGLAF